MSDRPESIARPPSDANPRRRRAAHEAFVAAQMGHLRALLRRRGEKLRKWK